MAINRALPSEVINDLNSGSFEEIFFYEIHLATPLYFTNFHSDLMITTLTSNGAKLFKGNGSIIRNHDNISEHGDLKADQTQVYLNGADQNLLRLFSTQANYRNRRLVIRGLTKGFNNASSYTDESRLYEEWDGEIQKKVITDGETSSELVVTVGHPFFPFMRTNGRRTNPASYQRLAPGSKGMDHAGQGDVEVRWGLTNDNRTGV